MAIGKQVESNQKACLEMAQNEFAAAQSRVRDLDSKLNMLLVLLSALIVGIGTVASKWYEGISCLVFTLVVISMALMIGAVITILIGALPKSYYSLDTNWLTDKKKHNCDSDSFFIRIILMRISRVLICWMESAQGKLLQSEFPPVCLPQPSFC